MNLESRTDAGAEGLAAIRARPAGALAAFDFDGTLAPIVDDPDSARAQDGAAVALAELASHLGKVAVITGRPAAVAVEYGGLAGVEGLVVLGQYGRERWENGTLDAPEPPAGVEEARVKLPKIIESAPEGVVIEDKGHALAVHTRRAAEPEVALERLRSLVAALAERTGLTMEPGRFVLELRPPGMDKGAALRALVAELGSTAVLYAGDDLGDLAAYDAVDALRAGGVPGVTVCSASDEVIALAERADLVVDGPPGVVRLVESLTSELF
ncbi:trehalose-phosphatase [Actinomadura sp. DC4]|uniref:trehalose-phosphatase n=1 Tax=Actinomadura sp. DC4 TaxID=3055069 RepID=UPI0025B06BD0|nr:trehalose-phosphatase [Actinomadura sp. DC4]MDN3359987.1 trehalose-phosphatase [Actinomadura sp. DC4]